MFARRPFVPAFLTLVLVGALALGCDPKLTATDGTGGTGGGDGGDDVVQVTPEARAIGAMVATHLQIMKAALSTAAQFDDSASSAPVLRDFFTSDCVTIETLDGVAPVIEISFGDADPADLWAEPPVKPFFAEYEGALAGRIPIEQSALRAMRLIVLFALLPFAVYVLFLAYYLSVDLIRSVLAVPWKLDKLLKEKEESGERTEDSGQKTGEKEGSGEKEEGRGEESG